MGAFHAHGFVDRAFHVSQHSKPLLFMMLPALFVFVFSVAHSGNTLVVKFIESFSHLFEGSASVFLLLNGVVVTIIASSKMEQSIARKSSCGVRDVDMEERKQGLSGREGDRKFEMRTENQPGLEGVVPEGEPAFAEKNQENQASIEKSSDSNQDEQQKLILLPFCGDNHDEYEASAHTDDGHPGKDSMVSSQISSTRSDGDGNCGGTDNPAPSEEEAPSAEEVWAAIAAAKNGGDLLKASNRRLPGPGDDGNEHRGDAVETRMDLKVEGVSDVNGAPSTEEAPSAAEIWAAIMSNKTGGGLSEASDKPNAIGKGGVDELVPNAASADGAAAAAARIVRPERASWSSAPPVLSRPKEVRRPHLPIAARSRGDGVGEVEDLNRRAEVFIARFNERMRLQRLESLRRRRAQRRAQRRGGHQLQRHPSKGSNPRVPTPPVPRAGVMLA